MQFPLGPQKAASSSSQMHMHPSKPTEMHKNTFRYISRNIIEIKSELYISPSAPKSVQSRGAPNATRGAVHPPQGGRDGPSALRPHQGGLHVGQARDQTVRSPTFTARRQVHCEDVIIFLSKSAMISSSPLLNCIILFPIVRFRCLAMVVPAT